MRRIIVITGNGKGKTTAAIGASIRARGRGFKVLFFQFLKSKDVDYGEHLFFAGNKKIKLERLGLGCKKDFKYGKDDINSALTGLSKINTALRKERSKQVLCVIDEVSYPVNWKWFSVKEIITLLKEHPTVSFILTGRQMPKGLVALADTVSDIKEIKHAYQKGRNAQKGIEF